MRDARAWARARCVALAACAAMGCDGDRRDASRIVIAIDRYRLAENSGKPAAAEALAQTPCDGPEACAAKDACLLVSEPTARGLLLKSEVEARLDDVKRGALAPDAPAAKELPGKLEEASRLLDRGHAALTACDDRSTGLKLKYHL